MAELNDNSDKGSKPKNIRSKKQNSRVDLTAMVDLAFLLITFFMLTTSLGKPKSMDLVIPENTDDPMPIDENRTMTILIGDNDKVKYYSGKLEQNIPSELSLSNRELRNKLAKRTKEVLAYSTAKGKPDQGMIVLIKPGKESNYGNLVDVLDEMAISNVQTYAIVDIDPVEAELLK